MIAEFSDFECPFCAAIIRTLDAVQETAVRGDKVRIVYRQFPLTYLHRTLRKLPKPLCAHDQIKSGNFMMSCSPIKRN